MSIIHDALKKIQQKQQGQGEKADEIPAAPASKPSPSTGYIYSTTEKPAAQAEEHIEHLAPVQNKAKSVLAFLCALAITLGALFFFYQQLVNYFPQFNNLVKTSINKLIHKKVDIETKAKLSVNLGPLAKITVNPVKPIAPISTASLPAPASAPIAPTKLPGPSTTPIPTILPAPTDPPLISNPIKAITPETLNIHGVMSNGTSNVVLINDQVYQEGDEVDGVKIVKIKLDYITVNNNGKEEQIRVKS